MKKTLISLAALMMALPVMAADNCAYSPLQNLIRNIRSVNEINELIQRGVRFEEEVRCGGSLMQLAILRGNPEVLQAMLNQDRSRANMMVNTNAFYIQGASREIPLILFAAYYAPNADMIQRLVEAGADISKTDSSGRNVLWYMDQNPVLRSTALYDKLNDLLLRALVPNQTHPSFQLGGNKAQQQVSNVAGQYPQQPIPVVPAGPSVVEATN